MTTYVYDNPGATTARFYIDGDYVFPMSGSSQLFGSMGITGIPILQLGLRHFG
jgi:hypothetical protein